MENQLNASGEFCACFPQKNCEVWLAGDFSDPETGKPRLQGEPVADSCDRCRKPIDKHVLIIKGVKGDDAPTL